MPKAPSSVYQVASALRGIHATLTAAKGRPALLRIADALFSIDPSSISPFPPGNRNRVDFLGCTAAVSAANVRAIIAAYRTAQVHGYFLWLSPSERAAALGAMLLDHGFTRFIGSKYPTLIRSCAPPAAHQTTLTPRLVSAAEAAAVRVALITIYGSDLQADDFITSAGKPGVHHFLAYDGPTPVAAALLVVDAGLGYLGDAATAKSHRVRGAQNALIVARLAHGIGLGCTTFAVETLSRLKGSVRNLERQGFKPAFERKVFSWAAP